jgi:hypothetical protein
VAETEAAGETLAVADGEESRHAALLGLYE